MQRWWWAPNVPGKCTQRCPASLRSPAVAAAASPQRADALRWIIGRLAALQLATGALEEAAAHYKQLVQLDPSALSGGSGSCGLVGLEVWLVWWSGSGGVVGIAGCSLLPHRWVCKRACAAALHLFVRLTPPCKYRLPEPVCC